MPDSMIEKVALAILGTTYILDHDHAHTIARAAIEAMRDPTEAMVSAGYPFVADEFVDPYDLTEAWKLMIDAALGEKPPRALTPE